jgi:hypothetical protein
MSPVKDARPTNSSILTLRDSLLLFTVNSFHNSHRFFQVGVRRTMGRHCHDDRFPDAHVLSMDMSLVL